MKSLLVVLFTLMIGTNSKAESAMNKEITDEFTDKVKDVKVVDGNLEIYFSRHAAIYHIKKDHPKFKELQSFLETKKQNQSKVKITSIIPKMEIKDAME